MWIIHQSFTIWLDSPDVTGGFWWTAADLYQQEGNLTSTLWHGFLRLPAQPQPVAGEWPGEVIAHVEATKLSQQQHVVIAALQTGGGGVEASYIASNQQMMAERNIVVCFPDEILPFVVNDSYSKWNHPDEEVSSFDCLSEKLFRSVVMMMMSVESLGPVNIF